MANLAIQPGEAERKVRALNPNVKVDALATSVKLSNAEELLEGVDVIIPALEQMRESAPAIPLIAKPNAGLPQLVEGETVYDLGPELFAERLAELMDLGIRVVGGCCGSTPDHILALAQHLNLLNS